MFHDKTKIQPNQTEDRLVVHCLYWDTYHCDFTKKYQNRLSKPSSVYAKLSVQITSET